MAIELELRHSQSLVEIQEAIPSVLVIDPDPAFCIVVGIMLKLQGYSVRRANNVQSARSIIELIRPDLIVANGDLLANRADDLSGYLSNCPDEDNVPLIAIQSSSKDRTPPAAEGTRIDAHLSRPFTADELHHLIGQLL